MSGEVDVTERDELVRWNRWFNPVVVVAALLPLAPVIGGDDPTGAVAMPLAIACWLVFVVDLVARVVLADGFLRSWVGRLYLVIVVGTAPLYLLRPGLEETDVLVVSRLAWLVVLAAIAARGMRGVGRLAMRLGRTGLYAATAVVVGAVVVWRVEQPEGGFETFGDSLWWSVVTITTVGYGDVVPTTTTGRATAAALMVAGLAFLGVVAASLAAFFGAEELESTSEPPQPQPEVLGQLKSLSAEVARLSGLVEAGDRHAGGGVSRES